MKSKRNKKDKKKRKRDAGTSVAAEVVPDVVGPLAAPAATVDNSVAADAAFWRSLLLAVETRPIGAQQLRGASGLEHRLVDVGIDQGRNRVVILTDSPDPKVAAFVQSDLQQAHPSQKVIAARAVLVNVSPSLKHLAGSAFMSSLSVKKLQGAFARLNKEDARRVFEPALDSLMGDARLRTHSPLAFIHQLLTQLVALDWTKIEKMTPESSFGPLLSAWSQADGGDVDTQLGVCPLPVFNMSADEVENVKLAASLDVAKELLSRHGVWEYFFPRATELALGLIDRGVTSLEKVEQGVALAPQQGHPLAESTPPRVEDIVDALRGQGFVVEGELGFQTTVAGAETRALVKFKPKESLLVKLKNLMSVAPLLKYFIK